MKAIIFGVNGQDGYYLCQLLSQQGVEVVGVDRHSTRWINGDVSKFKFVESLIKKYKPDYIFHFAATSSTNHDAIFENHKAIGTGTLNILESAKRHARNCKIFLSGSALQFKNDGKPIDEQTPFEAKSAYAVERIQSVYAARYFRKAFNLKVYVGYFFNHDSPMRPERHVSQHIVKAIKHISKGSEERLEMGDIKVKKEFNYAGDIVRAVWILVNQDSVFEVVIGCGEVHSLEEWVKYCFNKIGKNWKNYVKTKEGYLAEYKILVSNPELIKSLGWQPKIDFYGLADMMMEISE